MSHLVTALEATQDDDPADVADNHLFAQRYLRISPTFDGAVAVDGLLDPETGHLLLAALTPLAHPAHRRSDFPEASPETTDAEPAPGVRTRGQRIADALAELVSHALAAGRLPTSGGQRPHATVVVDVPTLTRITSPDAPAIHGRLASLFDTSLGGEALRRLTCDASLEPVVIDGAGIPLAAGRTIRTVNAGQHRALRLRDDGCVFPGCGRPHDFTDAHHVLHWADGGPTDLDNLVSLCRRHHRLVHHSDWELQRDPDGHGYFRWRPPHGAPPIPAGHAHIKKPLTTLLRATEVARIKDELAERQGANERVAALSR